MAFFMFWEVLWPLALGFVISAIVQTVVSKQAIVRTLGKDNLRGVTFATLFGAASSSCSYAAVAIAPQGAGGRDVEVVRLALQDPSALAKHRHQPEAPEKPHGGVVIDLSRKRLVLDDETAALTYKEFELLQYLVLREGRTIDRAELISSLWSAGDDDAPNERTIDVHVRRLRSKLGAYEDIVRTVRGVGYRFDRHADVSIRHTSTPSPDIF